MATATAIDVREQVRELHATGKGPREIARIIGIGRNTAYRILAQLGLNPNPVQRFRTWTPEQRARVSLKMRGNHNRADGLLRLLSCAKATARRVGRAPKMARAIQPATARKFRAKLTPQVREKIRELHLAGKPPREIAHTVGVAFGTTYRILREFGLAPNSRHILQKPAPVRKTQTSFLISLRKPFAESLREWFETVTGAGTLDRFLIEILENAIVEFRSQNIRKEDIVPSFSHSFARERQPKTPTPTPLGRLKINPMKVQRILFLRSEGVGVADIATRIGCSRSTVGRVQKECETTVHVLSRSPRHGVTWGDSGGGRQP